MATERRTKPDSPDIDTLRPVLYVSIRQKLDDAKAQIPPVERIGQRRRLVLTTFPQTPQEGDAVAFRVAKENFRRAVRRATGEFRGNPDVQKYREEILGGAAYIQVIVAREVAVRQGTKNPISLVESLKNNLDQMQARHNLSSDSLQPDGNVRPARTEAAEAGLLGARLFADFATSIRQKPPVFAGRSI